MRYLRLLILPVFLLFGALRCTSPEVLDTPREKNYKDLQLTSVDFLVKESGNWIRYDSDWNTALTLETDNDEIFLSIPASARCSAPTGSAADLILRELNLRLERVNIESNPILLTSPMASGAGARFHIKVDSDPVSVYETGAGQHELAISFRHLPASRRIEIDLGILVSVQTAALPVPMNFEAQARIEYSFN